MIDSREIIKLRIIEKAKDDFKKFGYSQVKTETLASELGMSKRTLYEYFNSKEELLSAVIESEIAMIHDKIHSIVKQVDNENSDFIDILKQLWQALSETSCTFTKEFFDNLQKYAPNYYYRIEKFRIDEIKTNFTKLYTVGIKKGFIKKNINKEIFYMIFHYSLHHILKPDVISELPVTTQQAVENIVDVLLTGSLTDNGRDVYLGNKK